jgi:hypothetical protein
MAGDNGRVWSVAVEVPRTEMTRGNVIDRPKHLFACDVRFRLGQIATGAVRYEFADEETARAYRGYVARRLFTDVGPDAVRSRVRRSEDEFAWYVYFSRGANYPQLPVGCSKSK